ncbi:MAG TPA: ComF family protein [Gammaproteobacteria bacterium]|nr:ComF family protein [Gammaproteobacteria bacterium]
MIHFIKKFTRWVLPHVCIFCKNISHRPEDLCSSCLQNLPVLKQGCLSCANVLPLEKSQAFCGECLQKKPPFDITHSLFLYQPPVPKLILDLKFYHALTHAKLLGELLAEKIIHEWYQESALPTVIIPMPLHVSRLKERGFNQAVEIARPIAKALDLPLMIHDVARIKPTLPQATLSADKRKKNVKNAFLIKKSLENQHVAVVDDVITTGNTMREFCRMLKRRGAGKISVWCCARALKF